MSLITWDDSYSVHDATIDAQHKEWIAIYNRLDQSLLHGEAGSVNMATEKAVAAMREYATFHFRHEELYLQQLNYPYLVEHRRLHTDFEDQLFAYARKMRNRELLLSTEVISTLKEWLQNHILREDRKYADYADRAARGSLAE